MKYMLGTVFTIGHSRRPLTEFVHLLTYFGIETLIDVRSIPKSRFNPQFSQGNLSNSLAAHDITYRHVKDLGGLRKAVADSPNLAFRDGGFRGYADYMMTREFHAALNTVIAMSEVTRIALMCAEANPENCHRNLISDALAISQIPVEHILSEQKISRHELNPLARIKDGCLLYPAPLLRQMELFK